jgi:excisionase family DNA binding protein
MPRSRSNSAFRPARSSTLPTWITERTDNLGPNQGAKDDSDAPSTALSFLTIDEVAASLRVSSRTVRRMIADGRIACVRVGRSVRISGAAVIGLGVDG